MEKEDEKRYLSGVEVCKCRQLCLVFFFGSCRCKENVEVEKNGNFLKRKSLDIIEKNLFLEF